MQTLPNAYIIVKCLRWANYQQIFQTKSLQSLLSFVKFLSYRAFSESIKIAERGTSWNFASCSFGGNVFQLEWSRHLEVKFEVTETVSTGLSREKGWKRDHVIEKSVKTANFCFNDLILDFGRRDNWEQLIYKMFNNFLLFPCVHLWARVSIPHEFANDNCID